MINKIMNKIKRFFLKRKKEKEYKKYINEHKKNIIKAFYEMVNCKELEYLMQDPKILKPLWFRILEHDDSKFDKDEFDAYRKHFNPIDEQEKKENEENFDKAVKHHIEINDHHWQHRVNWKNEDFNINTQLACLENIADWLAVGYKFHDRPYEYYNKHKDKINLPEKQKNFIEKCIYEGIDKKYIKEGEDKNGISKEKERK